MTFKNNPKQLEKCRPPDTHTILSRFCNLLQDEEACILVPRQLLLLSNFFSETKGSVMIADLELIAKVVQFLSLHIENEPRYKDPFLALLSLLRNIPKLSKSSDSLYYEHTLAYYLSTLGRVLHTLSDPSLQLEVLHILHKILNRSEPVALDNVKLATCIRSLELSYLPDSLADLLLVADPLIVQPLLNIILRICILSENSCWGMLRSGIHETLLIRLTPSTVFKIDKISLETMDLTLQILWRILSCTHKPEDWKLIKPLSKAALMCMQNILQTEVMNSSQNRWSRDNRNNFVAILVQYMFLFPNNEWVSSGIVEDIVMLSVVSIVPVKDSWVSSVVFTSHEDDFQFKKLLLAALTLCPKSNSSIRIMEKHCLTEALVNLLNPRMSSLTSLSLSNEQMSQLLEYTLDVISNLLPWLCHSFLKNNLIIRLLVLLEISCSDSCLTLDTLATVFRFVRTIYSICLIGEKHEYVKQELRKSNAVLIFFKMCEKLSLKFTTISQTTLAYCLSILVSLLSNQAELQEEYGDMGINLAESLCKHILKPTYDDFLIDNKLILALGNFLWEVIVWHKPNALKFIHGGHVYYILDILETNEAILSITNLYLSLLVDLCTYIKCDPYLLTWRSQKHGNLLAMLCKLWRETECILGVKRNKDGCLTDIEQPLMGREQYRLSKYAENFKSSPAILDVIGNIRPKINAIVQIVCHHNKDFNSLLEEYYRLGYNKLTPKNQVTLQLIKAYLPLKMGEIHSEYDKTNRQISPLNRYIITTLLTRYRHWAISIQNVQHSILREQNSELKDEKDYYSLLKSCHLSLALEAQKEILYIARTSNRQFLLQAKEKQMQETKITNDENCNEIQKTYPHDINITTLNPGRIVHFKYRQPLVSPR